MNKKLSIVCLIAIIASLMFSCRGKAKEQSKSNTSSNPVALHDGHEKYIKIDTKESVLAWKGSMQIGPNAHNGYVYISKGELMIEHGQLVGGAVQVDMNTIEDENHKSDNNLIKHLKDPDFFDVKRFPFTSIVITAVESINEWDKKVSGNLTIKGITKPVSFPANVAINNGIVRANGRLVIDRTQWDVRYKSGKFYDLLADQVMSDSIEFDIKIVARK